MLTRQLLYLPNLLSLSRLVVTPLLAYLIRLDTPSTNRLLIALLVLTAATDFFDGYFARRLNQRTELGKVLDALSDKILITVLLGCLVWFRGFPGVLFFGLLSRDIVILTMGTILSRRLGRVVEANWLGKANTVVFTVTALVFLVGVSGPLMTLLFAASFVTLLASGVVYYQEAEPHLLARPLMKHLLRASLTVFFFAALWLGQ